MKVVFTLILFIFLQCPAAVDIGIGASSFTGGRSAPALAVGLETENWGILFRSVGVQTTIYSQNAWTVAACKNVYSQSFGVLKNSIGAGIGGSYILRSYRPSVDSEIETTKEYVLGPHLSAKFEFGPVYLGFDTLLGLTKDITQHLVLNFQDMSHVTFGFTF